MAAEAKKTGEKKPAKKVERPALKAKLKALKKVREAAKESKDEKALARARAGYRRTTHALRATAPPKGKKAKKE